MPHLDKYRNYDLRAREFNLFLEIKLCPALYAELILSHVDSVYNNLKNQKVLE